MSSMSCIVVGDESLLIQCSEMLFDHGHTIRAVVTKNSEIRDWAEGRGLRIEAHGSDLADRLGPLSCDWLFSIANLNIISDDVVAKAKNGAVNFHDGPLPRFAGLNAPVWAILGGERTHGVTWHLIGGGVDKGDILAQRIFDIAPDETALTLNTKCYEAAIESFADVVTQLESGEPELKAQDFSKRSYFGRDQRPAAAGRLDFRKDADSIDALIRGLDHGGYWNPLTCPKIEVDSRIVVVGKSRVEAGSDAAPVPGTILSVDEAELVVSTGREAIVLGRLTDLSGRKLTPSSLVSVGDVLHSLTANDAAALTAEMASLACHDTYWRNALQTFSPLKLPFASSRDGVGGVEVCELATPVSRDTALGAVALWASQFSETSHFDLAFRPVTALALPANSGSYASDWVPFHISTGANVVGEISFGSLIAETTVRKTEIGSRATFACDLPLRDPSLIELPVPDIGLSEEGELIPGTALTVVLGTEYQTTRIFYDRNRISEETAQVLSDRLSHVFEGVADGAFDGTALRHIPKLPDAERQRVLYEWNETAVPYDRERCVHQLFEMQVQQAPDAIAVVCEADALSYFELNAKANQVAHVLVDMGVGPGSLVGLHTSRSLDLVVGALAIQKAGGAYVPLDPAYPADRIAIYVEDSGAEVILTQSAIAANLPRNDAKTLEIDADPRIAAAPTDNPQSGVGPMDLAYLIFTSGSTGRPKGVMVEHRNVSNFFTGMDARIKHEPAGVWLAVTSLSFDISVLELFYSLARGFKLVLSSDENRALVSSGQLAITDREMDFSLYYWGNDDGAGPKKYQLLLEGAKFADKNGFCAVWTPERHFHAFGGPYPNPSVTGAAVAAVTENIGVRAGSCVAPLHHPARIAEEWAVIDNLTNGRAGMAIASGWQPDDFVLRPENTPPENKPAMFDAIDKVRKLWRGEAVEFPKKDGTSFAVVTQPRPVSKEMPVWVTTAGNPATWKEAGTYGANVLTHLLGQSIKEVEDKIKIYHHALREAGHDPADHTVTLMLHTYVGNDREEVRNIAREPMKDYLRSAAGLIKQYAWAFPAFKKPEGASNAFDIDLGSLADSEMESILDFAFQRYFEESGLFGTVEDCVTRVEALKRIGVDEIACLIDYGIAVDRVMEGLHPLAEVLRHSNAAPELAHDDFSIAAQIIRHKVTHLQCTPSMARMMAMNDEARFALRKVENLMIGGEPLPGSLVTELREMTSASIENMYGPTETTIWSSTETATVEDGVVNTGTPIANTQLYVLDANREPVPIGVAGELYIAGDGVARGYWQRDDLTSERFVSDPFANAEGGRMYRTGDLVRWRFDGKIEFIGRIDHQVKIRGYRIELGEIEARLEALPGIRQAVVSAREDAPGDVRLVGYVLSDQATVQEEIRKSLGERLPDFMVPSRIIALDAFPLTPNKKVDRSALPAPSAVETVIRSKTSEAPKNDIEAQIADVWKRVLGLSDVAAKDNFFDIGGHSLLAVQVHREIKAVMNTDKLSITDIFRFPTLEGLAKHLGADAAAVLAAVDTGKAEERASARADAMSKRRAMRAERRTRLGG